MWNWLATFGSELVLFAGVGFLFFGVEDVIFDIIWLRHRAPEHRIRNLPSGQLVSPKLMAIFVPAWQEEAVIGAMLRRCTSSWGDSEYIVFVGCYPNDAGTASAVRQVAHDRISLVTLDHDGPTTKADCLNGIWQALVQFEQTELCRFSAIVLHDSEDKVHLSELDLFGRLIENYALVQIPVIPEPDRYSRWIAGHYLDEFAEAHRKDMPARQALGASLPSAGTGCAIRRDVLESLAQQRQNMPFDAASLTEDYELGLRIGEAGWATCFARVNATEGDPIAVRSCFPSTLGASVRQKTRWIIGIALAGWDRTGWSGGSAEHWMRWRDRRALLAATFILAAYLGGLALFLVTLVGVPRNEGEMLPLLLSLNACSFLWRLAMRASFTGAQYGWRQGVLAVPRIFVSNIIAVMAAWRALLGYCRLLWGGKVFWDKTTHQLPRDMAD